MRYAVIVLVLGAVGTTAVLVQRRQPLPLEPARAATAKTFSGKAATVAVEQQIVVPRIVTPDWQREAAADVVGSDARRRRAANAPEGHVRRRAAHAAVPSSALARLLLGDGAFRPQPFPRPG
ncbi:MAG TPA: hypothetical protein VG871_12445, partial [Vicinamibacterales bacterium]|nr:hypothetical protein [Vicinamibacterales bacterium]